MRAETLDLDGRTIRYEVSDCREIFIEGFETRDHYTQQDYITPVTEIEGANHRELQKIQNNVWMKDGPADNIYFWLGETSKEPFEEREIHVYRKLQDITEDELE